MVNHLVNCVYSDELWLDKHLLKMFIVVYVTYQQVADLGLGQLVAQNYLG